jgi:hypothetical protein
LVSSLKEIYTYGGNCSASIYRAHRWLISFNIPCLFTVVTEGVEALQERQLEFDLIMCYKVMHNFVDIDISDLFCLHSDDRNRGHNICLVKPACDLDVRKYCFSSRVIDLWNNLPQQVVNLTTVNSFQSALNHLRLHCTRPR